MNRTPLRILLVALALAGCADDAAEERPAGQRTGARADSAAVVAAPEPPRVTPAESARAARAVQSHSDSIRRAAEAEAGVRRDERAPAPRPRAGNSREERYRACAAQAEAAPEEVRARLQRACENIRNQPER